MTPALELLIKSRKVKTEAEVEAEFNKQQKLIAMTGGQPQKNKETKKTKSEKIDETALQEVFGNTREKSVCLLLPSHIEIMRDIFVRCDKYNDQILKRSSILMQMRTEQLIVDFIDVEAVKVASSKQKILTLD